ncbi:MAG: hypothetical protein DMG09_17080 [Acidobacteria bacterium]|nr:MAG: hypothetical protein DMG09_17080 [Acidobacteriota bacterium]
MSMIKKGFSAFALLLVCFYACAKKEEAPSGETPAVPAKPAFTPGETVLIPAGEFIFGSSDKETTAFPQQKINLPAFRIDKYEVTNAEYLDFCIKAPYASEGNYRLFFTAEKGRYPVVNITWNDAVAYCKWAGKRLPTEQEWEKAARGADGRRYPWGEKWESGRSNTYEASKRGPTEVNSLDDVSPYGVHDMLGNAQEWIADWYKAYKGATKKDENFGERFRVLRGARWDIYGSKFYLWVRSAALPKALYGYGCRCAKDATAEEAAKGGKTN